MAPQLWHLSHKSDLRALALADRHYSRQKVGTPQFCPPGRSLVLLTHGGDGLWVTIWQRYVLHAWPGAWSNSLFRNESAVLSSELILLAVAATRAKFGEPPAEGMITFVDAGKIRRKRDPGRCYRKAGFEEVGVTKSGLIALRLSPDRMPAPLAALRTPMDVEGAILAGIA